MAEEDTKGDDSDFDLYCDLEDTGNFSKAHEEYSDTSENAANDQSIVKDLDLFSDVVSENFVKAEQEKLERVTLIAQNTELKKLNSQLEAEINALMKKNRILARNICALYKTAKAEVSRKDAMIADLRRENEDMVFRRTRLSRAGYGGVRRFSKFQVNGGPGTCGTQGDGASVTNSCADGHATVEECNQTCENSGRRLPYGISSLPSFGNTHKNNSEKRRKLPIPFQDPETDSCKRHSLDKLHRRSKKAKMSEEMQCDSEGSSESYLCHSRLSGYSSESDAMDSSKLAKRCNREETLSASQVPEDLIGDSLKLFGYQGKPIPIAVKKKVLGCAKSPTEVRMEKENNNKEMKA